MTEEQWRWLQCQLLLDDGVQACARCDALSTGAYCPGCGARVWPEGRECPACHVLGLGAYCMQCGAALTNPVADAIDMHRFDWQAWAESLTPFLGGMTAQEQQLMHGNGVSRGGVTGP